jgi:hypothetical protein
MKVKIQEITKTVVPTLQNVGVASFLSLIVKQIIKYKVFPVKIKKV